MLSGGHYVMCITDMICNHHNVVYVIIITDCQDIVYVSDMKSNSSNHMCLYGLIYDSCDVEYKVLRYLTVLV